MSRLEVTLPGRASSVPPARRFVERTLESWDLTGAGWTAALLVSELAANAALHAGTDFTVVVERTGDRVRLEVHDGSATVPRQRRHSSEATTGRGLHLVAELADAWGVQATAAGKLVWVELSARQPRVDRTEEGVDVDALLAGFTDEVDEPRAGRRPPMARAA
ncbi:MAG TPA: ATP-binding protein [Mycobacteriales bacterium]|nr:ATP-binding protein [Mycobacteriales bacterium]